LWKQDLEKAEMCYANDRFLSKMASRLRAESTGETKVKKLSFRRIKRQEIGRQPVRYVSYSVIKVSDVMREIQS